VNIPYALADYHYRGLYEIILALEWWWVQGS